MSQSRRPPRVSFVTQGSATADGLYKLDRKIGTGSKPSTTVLSIVELSRRAETTIFGKYLILLAGSKILVKRARRQQQEQGIQFNTPQWEATYQNVAWQHGLAPRVYGYNNQSRVITMAAPKIDLKSLLTGDDKPFPREMQLNCVELVHRLDEIGIVHGHLVPENIMLDAFDNMFAINFDRARPVTETEVQTAGSRVNLSSCIDSWIDIVEKVNRLHEGEQENVFKDLKSGMNKESFDMDEFIAKRRRLYKMLDQTSKNPKKTLLLV